MFCMSRRPSFEGGLAGAPSPFSNVDDGAVDDDGAAFLGENGEEAEQQQGGQPDGGGPEDNSLLDDDDDSYYQFLTSLRQSEESLQQLEGIRRLRETMQTLISKLEHMRDEGNNLIDQMRTAFNAHVDDLAEGVRQWRNDEVDARTDVYKGRGVMCTVLYRQKKVI